MPQNLIVNSPVVAKAQSGSGLDSQQGFKEDHLLNTRENTVVTASLLRLSLTIEAAGLVIRAE
jgi:hypothetical protein